MPRAGKNPEDYAVSASMTDAQIQAAKERLKKLKDGPPPDERKNSGRRIVEKLYDQIAAARAAGWDWERIKREIGDAVAAWKPDTLARYFQLAKARRRGRRSGPEAGSGGSEKSIQSAGDSRNRKARGRSGSSERERGDDERPGAKYNADVV